MRLIARGRARFDPATGAFTLLEPPGWLREIIWERGGYVDPDSGHHVPGTPRRLLRSLRWLEGHWLRHWTHYVRWIVALACAAIGSDAIYHYVQYKCVDEEGAEQSHDRPATPGLLGLDLGEESCDIPLRCD